MIKPPNVYVDLDGTLTPSDLLFESCLQLVRRNPCYVFAIVWWALHGALCLKQQIARRVAMDWRHLPLNHGVLTRLRELKTLGHELVLASASWHEDVSKVAALVGLFDRVLATRTDNLKGELKLQAIQADASGEAFVYFGNAMVDIPIWKAASVAVAVNASSNVQAQAKQQGIALTCMQEGEVGLRAWLKSMRLHQWAKNVLLFLPLIAAHSTDRLQWGLMLLGFFAFGLLASATYMWNDLMDLEADRQHPRKCKRPLASGRLSIQSACLGIVLLGGTGFALAFGFLGLGFGGLLVMYTVLTLFYTFVFKRMVLVDVLVLALLYTLRVVAGSVETGIVLSGWLLTVSLFVFLSLALMKRCAELELLSVDGGCICRRGYRASDLGYLVPMGISSGFVAVLVMTLYMDSQQVLSLYRTPEFLWPICPLFLYWLMRLWILTSRKEMIDDPVHFTIRDPISWAVIAMYAVCVLLAI